MAVNRYLGAVPEAIVYGFGDIIYIISGHIQQKVRILCPLCTGRGFVA